MPRVYVAAALTLAVLSLPSLGAQDVGAQEGCLPRKLLPSPAAVTSGVFSADGETLLLSDPVSQTLFPFSSDGRAQGKLPPALAKALQDLPPQWIARQDNRLLLGLPRSRVVTLGDNYSLKAEETISTSEVKSKKQDLKLLGMYRWQPVGSDILAFSDIEESDQRYASAFVRFPARDPASFEVLHSIGMLAPMKAFYQLGFPYIASLGGEGYAVLMKNPIEIYRSRNREEWRPLSANAVPDGFEQSPELPTYESQEDIIPVMASVEKSKMPVGLYGWKGFLYMLTREPEGQGTRWTIFKIDPRREEVVGSTLLPTRASQLVVIPGPKRWAIIEKSIEGWRHERIGDLILVPASRLEGKMPANLCRPGELRR
jgi:hypothetical protein